MLILLAATGAAKANYYELLRRVPESANTLILIDVERLLMSPIAMKEKWRDRLNSPDAGTIHAPVNSVRYMLASQRDNPRSLASRSRLTGNTWDAGYAHSSATKSLRYRSISFEVLENQGMLKSNQMQVYSTFEEKTAEVRRKMTLKYKVEF
jgi:hypothetical protein